MYAFVNMSSIFPAAFLDFLIYLREAHDIIWTANTMKIRRQQDILNDSILIISKYKIQRYKQVITSKS